MGSIEESKAGEAMLSEVLHFRMERHTDDGVYYVISGVEIALVTDGATIEEALHNLREAVEVHFEGDERLGSPKMRLV
jgi:predicted RNase H-like HicB family nuclease